MVSQEVVQSEFWVVHGLMRKHNIMVWDWFFKSVPSVMFICLPARSINDTDPGSTQVPHTLSCMSHTEFVFEQNLAVIR